MQSGRACNLRSEVLLTIRAGVIKSFSTHQFFAFPHALRAGYYKRAPPYTNSWSVVDRKPKREKRKRSLEKKQKRIWVVYSQVIFFSHILLFIPLSLKVHNLLGNLLTLLLNSIQNPTISHHLLYITLVQATSISHLDDYNMPPTLTSPTSPKPQSVLNVTA